MDHNHQKNTAPKKAVFYKEIFETLIQDAPVSMYALENGEYAYINQHFCELFGYSEEELLAGDISFEKIIHPDDLDLVHENIAKRMENQETNVRYRVRAFNKSGRLLHIEIHATKTIKDDTALIFGTVIDVTEEVTANLLLKENQERFHSLFFNNPDAIFSFDLAGKFIDANPGCEQLTGYSLDELLEMSFTPLILSEYLPKTITSFEKATRGVSSTYESAIHQKDGKQAFVEITNFPMIQEGKITGAYGIAKDITSKIEYRKQMEDLAFYDPLTKLPNRKLFEDRLQQVSKVSKENGYKPAVLFLDLDRFKFINDSLGHHLGDEFLKIVSQRLQQNVRKTDTVGRIAGDEFAVFLPNADEKEAILLAERLSEVLNEPFNVLGHSVTISASIGIAFSDGEETDVTDLMKKADTAMYYTKKYGSTAYTIYSKELDVETKYKLIIERDLKSAIANEEFTLHYQPIIDLNTSQLSAMEALIRWKHPSLGLIPPDRFIPVSEESGQIIAIGNWVLRTACRQNKEWQNAGHNPFKICVNISTIQLQHPNFVDSVQTILEETGLDSKWLELEVTEGILMEDTRFLKDSLLKLKALGVSMSIDDFGTGYTSLSYLRQFSFDRVKIDRSFIEDISTDLNGKAITSTIISLAHKLQIGVIAEGIEHEHQLSFLQEETCDEGQGYYFSRPLAPEMHSFPLSLKK